MDDQRDYAEEAANRQEMQDQDHCFHHRHDGRCDFYEGLCDENANDDCVHCPCCCICLACEYGPRDGMLMFPEAAEK